MTALSKPPPLRRSIEELYARKSTLGVTVSVCLPALNEVATVGGICRQITPLLDMGLIDQLAVVDSGSSDGTLQAAGSAGAQVFEARALLPHVDAPGKGGTLWKSLSIATGDIVLWADSDTRNFKPSFITDLLAPFIENPGTRMTKAFYERPISHDGHTVRTGGARVTELVVRPLAHLLFPELTDLVQPLSGEYGGYREDLIALPFFSGYGVEVGLLIDFIQAHGSGGIRQVDLGARLHDNQDVLALGRMAHQVLQVMTKRAEDLGRMKLAVEWPSTMTQFVPTEHGASTLTSELEVVELPPIKTLL